MICDCEIFWLTADSCEWGGGGWAHHMGPGEELELGKINAHGATNKQ